MKNLALKVFLGCFIAASSFAGHAQSSGNSTPNVSGKWSGSFDVTPPDGTLQHDTAWLNLTQDGSALTGTAGPNEGKQSEIQDGKVNGGEVQFTVPGPGGQMLINLHLEDDHLKGEGTVDLPDGKLSAKIDVTRLSAISGHAPPSPLYDEIAHMDAVLFNAFNARDFDTIKTLFTPDLEFYHDKAGLTSYQQNMESFKNHFASSTKVRRELVSGSLEVYPIKGYGAIEVGVHRFYSTEPGGKEQLTATAKFVHIWQEKDGQWKISRVVSYDHE
jgi:ketosteroid isomerase-like protein